MSTTFTPRYTDLITLLETAVKTYGPQPLFGTKRNGVWSWVSYADFSKLVDKLRAGLAGHGVGKGDRVAVVANNRVEWATGAYASYGLGAAYVPMYETQQEKEWKYILNDCGAKICLAATADIARRVRAMKGELPKLEQVICFEAPSAEPDSYEALLAEGDQKPVPAVKPEPKDIACYIYTSGTTGNPKGVLLSQSNLACNVSANLSVFDFLPTDRSLSFLPWAHAFGQTAELHTLIAAGASTGICEAIPKLVDNLAEVRPTVLMSVPNIFMRIYDGVRKQMADRPALIQRLFQTGIGAQGKLHKNQPVSFGERVALFIAKRIIFTKIVARFGGRLRFAVSGGAALPREVAEFVDALGITVYEGYGLTETSPVATCNTPAARKVGSVGKAIPGVTIKLDFEASGNTEEGEIIVYGHNVMQGYYNQPDESAKVFTPDGGFRTGDLGKLDADGFLYITGRIKELYKLDNGKYVAPAALEGKLQLSAYIAQALVFGSNKPFNVAVLVPNLPNLKEWAKGQGLDPSDVTALLANPKTRALIRGEVDAAGKAFKGFETIKDFYLAAEEFTVANDLLTPKLSMKRRNVVKRYEKELDALYAANAKGAKTAAA